MALLPYTSISVRNRYFSEPMPMQHLQVTPPKTGIIFFRNTGLASSRLLLSEFNNPAF